MSIDLGKLSSQLESQISLIEKQPSVAEILPEGLGFMQQFNLVRKLTHRIALQHIKKAVKVEHMTRQLD